MGGDGGAVFLGCRESSQGCLLLSVSALSFTRPSASTILFPVDQPAILYWFQSPSPAHRGGHQAFGSMCWGRGRGRSATSVLLELGPSLRPAPGPPCRRGVVQRGLRRHRWHGRLLRCPRHHPAGLSARASLTPRSAGLFWLPKIGYFFGIRTLARTVGGSFFFFTLMLRPRNSLGFSIFVVIIIILFWG